MAQESKKRISIEAKLIRTEIAGGVSLDPRKRMKFYHYFSGDDGKYYTTNETSNALHTERVILSGYISGFTRGVDGQVYFRILRPLFKEVR